MPYDYLFFKRKKAMLSRLLVVLILQIFRCFLFFLFIVGCFKSSLEVAC